jgi:hypothetical protein
VSSWGHGNLAKKARRGAVALLVLGAVLAAQGAGAKAATITSVINFSATAFNVFGGGTAPVDPVVGSFTITYDPAVSVTNVTGSAITQNYLNITLGSAIAFSYDANVKGLTIGGVNGGVNSFLWGTNDFFFTLTGLTENSFYSPSPNLSYTQSDPNGSYYALNLSVTVAPATAVTPIPASALLFLTALGGLGFAGLKRRRAAAA